MINVKNLTFSYDSKTKALNNVSFSVKDGSFLSIIGHNGSGKSTLAKLLVGLLSDSNNAKKSGEIYYDDLLLDDKNINEIRKKVGIVFQNPDNQFVGVNVKYDMAFGLENHNIPREEMIELIDEYSKKVLMYEYLDKEPQALSGGQKQRVAIAGILALDVDVIILDEATSMLDPEGTRDIVKLIYELNKKHNKTVISITHDLDFARLSDDVIVLKNGEIIKEGTPEEVFNDIDTLSKSNLDMPISLKTYYMAKKSNLSTNTELMEALWEYHLTK